MSNAELSKSDTIFEGYVHLMDYSDDQAKHGFFETDANVMRTMLLEFPDYYGVTNAGDLLVTDSTSQDTGEDILAPGEGELESDAKGADDEDAITAGTWWVIVYIVDLILIGALIGYGVMMTPGKGKGKSRKTSVVYGETLRSDLH